MSKAFKWPKLPNSRPYLDKGYTSIQMREYAMKCIGEAIRNKQWIELVDAEFAEILCDSRYQMRPELMMLAVQSKLREKNCGQ